MADTVEIGRNGGKVRVESDLQIMFSEGGGTGGGHVTWRVSGMAAQELRATVDQNLGNADGNVSPSEAKAYTDALDNWLTNSAIVYHGGKMHSFSLLDRNRGVEDNTEYLIAKNSDGGTIVIRFLIEATLNTRDGGYDMNDDIFVTALFDVLSTGVDDYIFVGQVEIVHWNYIVGFSSFSNFDTDYGKKVRFRGPVWEVYRYTVSYDGGSMEDKSDRAEFDRFNVVQSPLELFIVCVALGYFMTYIPKRYAKTNRKVKVSSIHQMAWGFLILLFVIYFLGLNGLFIWVLGPLFLILVLVLSHKIYKHGWKGIAKPLSEAEIKELDRKDGIIRPESYKKLHPKDSARYVDPEPSRRRRRPARRERPREREYEDDYDDHYDDDDDHHDDDYDDHYDDDYDDRHDDGYDDDYYDDRRPRDRPERRRPPARREPEVRRRPPPVVREDVVEEDEEPEDDVHDMEPVAPVKKKKIRCAGCKKIFEAELKENPLKVKCPICGKQGLIRW
jgi:hypothetical protein